MSCADYSRQSVAFRPVCSGTIGQGMKSSRIFDSDCRTFLCRRLTKFPYCQLDTELHPFGPKRLPQWRLLDHLQDFGIESDEPKQDSVFTVSSLTFAQHLQGGVFKIGHTGEIEHHRRGIGFIDQGSYLLSDVFGVGKEYPPLDTQQQQARKY